MFLDAIKVHVTRILGIDKMASKKQRKPHGAVKYVHTTSRSTATTHLSGEIPWDYLQDPELWTDPLPQPFRMIDELLQNFLDDAWEEIVRLELQRKEEALKPRVAITTAFKDVLVPKLHGMMFVSIGNDPLLVLATKEGLFTAKAKDTDRNTIVVPGTEGTEVVALDVQRVTNTRTSIAEEYWLLAAATKEGIKHFLLHGDMFVQLKSIEFSQERQALGCSLTKGATHLALTFKEKETDYSLEVYQLPVSQWIADFSSSLVKHRDMLKERVEAETEGVPSSTGPYEPPDPSSFAKPTLLKKFGPPSYNNFGTDMDPAFALSNTAVDNAKFMSTGEKHLLTETYLSNRMKLFLKMRSHFIAEPFSLTDNSGRKCPHCHFVYHKQGIVQDDPASLLLWWEGSAQLTQYSLLLNPKSKDPAPVIERVWPLASHITCSRMSPDGALVALGLEQGSVVVTDLKSDIFHQVFTTDYNVAVTCLEFSIRTSTTSPSTPLLYAGNSSGTVYELDGSRSHGGTDRVVNHTQRVLGVPQPECKSPVEKIVLRNQSSAFIVVHKDGTVMQFSAPLSKIRPFSSTPDPASRTYVGHFACSLNGSFVALGEHHPGGQILQESKVHLVKLLPTVQH